MKHIEKPTHLALFRQFVKTLHKCLVGLILLLLGGFAHLLDASKGLPRLLGRKRVRVRAGSLAAQRKL